MLWLGETAFTYVMNGTEGRHCIAVHFRSFCVAHPLAPSFPTPIAMLADVLGAWVVLRGCGLVGRASSFAWAFGAFAKTHLDWAQRGR